MIPVRCFSCNKPIGHLYSEYQKRLRERTVSEEKHPRNPHVIPAGKRKTAADVILTELGCTRVCCRRMLFTHVPVDELTMYKNVPQTEQEKVCNREEPRRLIAR